MIRVVLDTNILVSALLQPMGPSARMLMLVLGGTIQLCVSGGVYAEYEEVIRRPRFRLDEETIASTLKAIRGRALWVKAAQTVRVCADPDDDIFVERASSGQAHYLVKVNLKCQGSSSVALLFDFAERGL